MPDPAPNPNPAPDPAASASDPPDGGSSNQNTLVRPENLADDYWDGEKGVVLDKLLGDFNGLKTFKAEADSRAARVPEKPEDYEVALPEGFKLPDGFKFEVDPKDPVLAPAREFAKKVGLTPEEFKEMTGLQAQQKIAEHEALRARAAKELEALGTKGPQRVQALTSWLQATFGNEDARELMPMLFTSKQVQVFEKWMDMAKGNGAPKFNGSGRDASAKQEISDEDWDKLSPTARLVRNRGLAAGKAH